MTGKLFINKVGTTYTDVFTAYGAFLEEGSYAKLLFGETMKPYTENTSRSIDGNKVLIKNPRIEAREFVLTFCFSNNGTDLLTNIANFLAALRAGKTVSDVPTYPLPFKVVDFNNRVFHLIYQGNTSAIVSGLTYAKVSVKFYEPDPTVTT